MIYYESQESVIADMEAQVVYHRRNAKRWDEGLTNGGSVAGIQGKMSQKACIAERELHLGQAMAYERSIEMLKAIDPEIFRKGKK